MDPGVAHGDLEGQEVHFVERLRVDVDADLRAIDLLVVAHEVLSPPRSPRRLHAPHVGLAEAR